MRGILNAKLKNCKIKHLNPGLEILKTYEQQHIQVVS